MAVTTTSESRLRPAALVALGAPSLVAAFLSFVALGSPSYWTDEAATLSATTRSTTELFDLLGNIDASHGVYYLLLHPFVSLFGTSEWVTRTPSAIFIIIATLGVTVLGYRLGALRLGCAAGLVFSLLPITSHYGMEARSSALACALVCWASVVLLIQVQGTSPHRLLLWFVYAVLIELAVLVFFYCVLVLVAHVVTVVLVARIYRKKQLFRPIAVCAGFVVLSLPIFLLLLSQQSQQLAWISPVSFHSIVASLQSWSVPHIMQPQFSTFTFWPLVLLLWLLVAFSVVRGVRQARHHKNEEASGLLLSLALPWLTVPIAVLFAVSLVHPTFTERYVFASTPAFALLVASGLLAIRPPWFRIAVAIIALALAIPVLALDRQATAKGDLRLVAEVLGDRAQTGGLLLFDPVQIGRMVSAYPDAFAGLRNIGITSSAQDSGTLAGRTASLESIELAIHNADEVWLVVNDANAPRYKALARILSNSGLRVKEQWNLQETIQLWGPGSSPSVSG